MDIVLKAFFERRATSLNRIVSELNIKNDKKYYFGEFIYESNTKKLNKNKSKQDYFGIDRFFYSFFCFSTNFLYIFK